MKIKDDTGHGYGAKVDDTNRLWTKSEQISTLHVVSETTGKAFYFTTGGFVTITSVDTEKAVFFLRNDTTSILFLNTIRTCGTSAQKYIWYKNPSSMSNPTAAVPVSINFGSSQEFVGDVQAGGESSALTDGTFFTQWINTEGHSEQDLSAAILLHPGDSMGISVEVASAGTDVCISILGHLGET